MTETKQKFKRFKKVSPGHKYIGDCAGCKLMLRETDKVCPRCGEEVKRT